MLLIFEKSYFHDQAEAGWQYVQHATRHAQKPCSHYLFPPGICEQAFSEIHVPVRVRLFNKNAKSFKNVNSKFRDNTNHLVPPPHPLFVVFTGTTIW